MEIKAEIKDFTNKIWVKMSIAVSIIKKDKAALVMKMMM
jgi:hypothetical protein